MPILALCEIMVQVYFAVHAIRTGRERQWLFVIIIFPGVGSLVYFFSEYLPDMQHAASLRKRRPGVNSSKHLRYLEDQVEITPSVKNKKALAEAYVHSGKFDKAIPIFESCLQGFYEKDSFIVEGLCCAYFFKGDFEKAKINLLGLKKLLADEPNNDFDLLLARAYEESGETDAAVKEYSALVKHFTGAEAPCRYALLLKKIGRSEDAKTIFRQIVKDSRLSPKFYQKDQKKWINVAKREV
ncbi:hypothetical protein D1BOALGB6SA_1867 [Olavius sp. associated proteobacterium Delta 1]|nr:hypothetical protein D1BOALGB6SA_1867 [Olavius sp. associated proteobacterium Delta 1]